jgi:hypothetical protein
MRLRHALGTALVLGLVAGAVHSPAIAAVKKPKPLCKIITDESGDGSSRSVGLISSPALDILSADIATGKKTVVAVLRVATTDVKSDTWIRLGYRWSLSFNIQGINYAFQRQTTTDKVSGAVTYSDTYTVGTNAGPMPAGSVTKMDATSYTWTIPRSAVPGLKKPRQVLNDLQTISYVNGGNADQAATATKYPDQYPSCVKAA